MTPPPPPGNQLSRTMSAVDHLVAGIRQEQWLAPTPCTDWKVRDLVNHLVGMNLVFAALMSDQRRRSVEPTALETIHSVHTGVRGSPWRQPAISPESSSGHSTVPLGLPLVRSVSTYASQICWSMDGTSLKPLTPLLQPEDRESRELAHASSLCGACVEVCPVRIPLVDMLLGLRRRDASDVGPVKRAGFSTWSGLWSSRPGFAFTRIAASVALPVARRARGGPGWASAWLRTRPLPVRTRRRTGLEKRACDD
jgi:ferredoxin